MLILYSYLGGWAKSGLTTYAAYMLATSLCLSPWIFNPFSLTVDQVARSFMEWQRWVDGAEGLSVGHGSWQAYHDQRMRLVRAQPLFSKAFVLSGDLVARSLLVVGTLTSLHLGVLQPPRLALRGSDAAASPPPPPPPAPPPPPTNLDDLDTLAIRIQAFAVSLGVFVALTCVHALLGGSVRRRLCCGSRLGGWLYFWLLSGACAAAYVLVCHYLLHEHFGWVDINSGACTDALDWRTCSRYNLLMLAVSALGAWSFLVACLGLLRYETPPRPTLAARACCATPARLPLWRRVCRAYSDYWYSMMDHLYAYAVMLALLFCSVLPLSQLQNAMTFNANYLRFINERQARSRFLLELLG